MATPSQLPVFFRTVLVLGADCEPGFSIIEALLAEGHRIVAWVRPGRAAQPWDSESVTVIHASLPDSDEAVPALPACDVVVLPNAVEDGDGPPESLWRIAESRYRAAERCVRACGAARLILLSSIEVPGPLADAEGERFEAQAPRPVEHSGGALMAVEQHAMNFARETQVSLVILRLGHLYGGGNPGCLARAIDLLREEGVELLQQEWSNHRYLPVHIGDAAQAVARAVHRGQGLYHISGAEQPTVGDLIRVLECVCRERGVAVQSVQAPFFTQPAVQAVHYRYPPERARRELGYQPRWTLEAGVRGLSERADVMASLAALRTASAEPVGISDWSEDQDLSWRLMAPLRAFLAQCVRRHGIRSVLALGCGDGRLAVWMARELGVRVIGVDTVPALVEQAKLRAAEELVQEQVQFRLAALAAVRVETPVDALLLIGTLDQHPLLTAELGVVMQRVLKPEGLVVVSGQHCMEGYHPRLSRVMSACFGSWLRRFFDESGFRQAIASERTRGFSERRRDGAEASQRRRAQLDERALLEQRHAHFIAPFLANALVVFQRSRLIRSMSRMMLPLFVALDGWMCRFPLPRSWAAWAVRSYSGRSLTELTRNG